MLHVAFKVCNGLPLANVFSIVTKVHFIEKIILAFSLSGLD